MKKSIISLLLCLALLAGMIPAGVLSLSAAAVGDDACDVPKDDLAATAAGDVIDPVDHSNPDTPYIATDYAHLQAAFNQERAGKTFYIKLGRNITFSGRDYDYDTHDGALRADGGHVVFDLAGYTLSYTAEQTKCIYTKNGGSVTVVDSKRYDSAKDEWIDGRVEFETKIFSDSSWYVFWHSTAIFNGNITIKGGVFINKNDDNEKECGYLAHTGEDSFKMTGGVIEAKMPLSLSSSTKNEISGGTLRVKDQTAITMYGPESSSDYPVISQCEIVNASGNAQVLGFAATFSKDYSASHTGAQALAAFSKIFPEGTCSFIDGVKQPTAHAGTMTTVDSKDRIVVIGPVFSSSYVLYPSVGTEVVSATVSAPKKGAVMSFSASVPSGSNYKVDTTVGAFGAVNGFKNGVRWLDSSGSYIQSGRKFREGSTYTVEVILKPADTIMYPFADIGDITATVNGGAATVRTYGVTGIVISRTFVCPPATLITNFELSIPEPAAGNDITYEAHTAEGCGYSIRTDYYDSDDEYVKYGVEWKEGSTTLLTNKYYWFRAGGTYSVSILIQKDGQPWFTYAADDQMTATVNGHQAQVFFGSYGIWIKYTFMAVGTIGALDLTVREPITGENPSFSASVNSGKGYEVEDFNEDYWHNGVLWQTPDSVVVPDDSTFAAGQQYKVSISLVLTDEQAYRFAPVDEMTVMVNGQEASVRRFTDENYIVSCIFTAKTKTVIRTLDVTIPAPKEGEVLSYYAGVPADKGYQVENFDEYYGWKNGVRWTDKQSYTIDSGTEHYFDENAEYEVDIYIGLSDSELYAFAPIDTMTATVNGKTARIKNFGGGMLGVCYTFGQPEIIDSVAVTIPSTRAGEKMQWTASIPDGVNYQFQSSSSNFSNNGVMWRVGNTTVVVGNNRTFEEGTIYKVTIFLEAKDGYTFASPDDMSATVNGEAAQITRTSDTKVNVSYTFTPAAVPVESVLLGDVDGDGKVDIFDASSIQKSLAGMEGYIKYSDYHPDDPIVRVADVDADKKVDIFDASLIQRFIAGDIAAKAYGIGQPLK